MKQKEGTKRALLEIKNKVMTSHPQNHTLVTEMTIKKEMMQSHQSRKVKEHLANNWRTEMK